MNISFKILSCDIDFLNEILIEDEIYKAFEEWIENLKITDLLEDMLDKILKMIDKLPKPHFYKIITIFIIAIKGTELMEKKFDVLVDLLNKNKT